MNSANKASSGSVSSIMAGKSSCQPPRRNMVRRQQSFQRLAYLKHHHRNHWDYMPLPNSLLFSFPYSLIFFSFAVSSIASVNVQANVALELRPSTDPQPTLATKAKRGLDVFPAAVLPPSGLRAPDSHDVSRKSGIPTTKPSGLRMPSPSLGFFGQVRLAIEPSNVK